MTLRLPFTFVLLLAIAACGRNDAPRPAVAFARPAAPAFKLPTDRVSIYPLATSLTDQNAENEHLDVFAGHPVVVSMFYGSCPMACPTLVRDIKKMEQSLDPAARADLRVLLVSFDPARDTPAALHAMAEAHAVDTARWRLARTTPDEARTLAGVLGIQYRRLGTGEYEHSVVISILDRKGAVVAREEGRPSDGELVEAIEAVEAASAG